MTNNSCKIKKNRDNKADETDAVFDRDFLFPSEQGSRFHQNTKDIFGACRFTMM